MGPGRPVLADISDSGRNAELLDLLGLNQQLGEETGGGVPGNVAVEGPDTRVLVGIELHDHVAAGTNLLDVAALGVLGVGDGSVPSQAVTLVKDVHVETMKMHGMTARKLVRYLEKKSRGCDLTLQGCCC